MLRDRIIPGPVVKNSPAPPELRGILHQLRGKINSAILRFEDEEGLESVDLLLTPNEAWIIDQTLSFDRPNGSQTNLLLQIMRGLWSAEYGLSSIIAEDPWKGWSKDSIKELLNGDLTN